jgi:NifU-like protein involved in Fe-S cluster formation
MPDISGDAGQNLQTAQLSLSIGDERKRMDEALIGYYRNLLRTGFPHAGSFENASISLDTGGENIPICGNVGDYMQLYVKVADRKITDIKYSCACDPPTNVAVEIMCTLVKGKTLEEAGHLTPQAFSQSLGFESAELKEKARHLLDFLNTGITQYQATKT